MSIQISFVKCIDTQPELLRFAPNFVERRKPVVNVERRILETLGHDRPGELLKSEHKLHVLFAPLRIQVFRKPEKQNVAEKIENRFLDRRVTALGGGNRPLDHLPIFVAHRLAGREISSINREAGNGLAYCPGESFKGEIAIPAVFLR